MEKALFQEDLNRPPLFPLLIKPARRSGGEGIKGWLNYFIVMLKLGLALNFSGEFQ